MEGNSFIHQGRHISLFLFIFLNLVDHDHTMTKDDDGWMMIKDDDHDHDHKIDSSVAHDYWVAIVLWPCLLPPALHMIL